MSVQTSSARTSLTGTVSGSATTILAKNTAVNFVRVTNPSVPGGGNLWVTYDGTTPVIGQTGIPLFPGGSDTNDTHVPTGDIKIIADTTATYYYLEYA